MTKNEFISIGNKLNFTVVSDSFSTTLYCTDLRVLDYHGNKMDVMRYCEDGRVVYWEWENTDNGTRHTTGFSKTIDHDEVKNILCYFKSDVKAMLKTRRKVMIEEI